VVYVFSQNRRSINQLPAFLAQLVERDTSTVCKACTCRGQPFESARRHLSNINFLPCVAAQVIFFCFRITSLVPRRGISRLCPQLILAISQLSEQPHYPATSRVESRERLRCTRTRSINLRTLQNVKPIPDVGHGAGRFKSTPIHPPREYFIIACGIRIKKGSDWVTR